jgi:hypothetical protein
MRRLILFFAAVVSFTILHAQSGNMGIGNSIPHHKLDLGSTSGNNITDSSGKKLAIYDNASGTDFYGLGMSSGTLQFHAASTPSKAPGMVLTSTGRIGIGIATPAVALDVTGRVAQTGAEPTSSSALTHDPLYRDNTTGIFYTAPVGFAKTVGGYRPGASIVLNTIDPTNSITNIQFVMYPDESNTNNESFNNNYLYGTLTIIGTTASGGAATIRNLKLFDGSGNPAAPASISGGDGSNIFAYTTANQGTLSLFVDQSTGAISVFSNSIYSYYFQFLGGH